MSSISDELTELLMDTVEREIQWDCPVIDVKDAVAEILKRWDLTLKTPEHSHSWIDTMDGDMKCSSCPAVHHYTF